MWLWVVAALITYCVCLAWPLGHPSSAPPWRAEAPEALTHILIRPPPTTQPLWRCLEPRGRRSTFYKTTVWPECLLMFSMTPEAIPTARSQSPGRSL